MLLNCWVRLVNICGKLVLNIWAPKLPPTTKIVEDSGVVVIAGMTNRYLAKIAQRVLTGFANTQFAISPDKITKFVYLSHLIQ